MKQFYLVFLLGLFCTRAWAQEEDKYLQVGPQDAGTLIKGYLQPLFKSIGYGFTSGWYTTAECHKPLGIDFRIMGNIVFIPSGERTYRFKNSDFDHIQLVGRESAKVPTVFGSQKLKNRPDLSVQDQNQEELVRVSAPPGLVNLKKEIGINAIPVPMVQLGLGLYRDTDFGLRFFPKSTFGKVSVKMFGYGIKHNLKQWIPRFRYTEVDLALMAAFNSLEMEADLPESGDLDNRATFRVSGLNLQAILSKEYFTVLTFFSGIGYSRAGSRTKLLGEYPINDQYVQLPIDPLDLRYGESSLNLTAGITLKLLLATISASQTFQKYPVTNFSVGVSFR